MAPGLFLAIQFDNPDNVSVLVRQQSSGYTRIYRSRWQPGEQASKNQGLMWEPPGPFSSKRDIRHATSSPRTPSPHSKEGCFTYTYLP